MTVLPRRLREGLSRGLLEAAERITTAEADQSPQVQALLEQRAELEGACQAAAQRNMAARNMVQAVSDRIADLERDLRAHEAGRLASAVAYAKGDLTDSAIDQRHYAEQRLRRGLETLKLALPELRKEAEAVHRGNELHGDRLGDLDIALEVARAEANWRALREAGHDAPAPSGSSCVGTRCGTRHGTH